nr:mdis1-interacting receptor like kinase 2 [Quercus suber]
MNGCFGCWEQERIALLQYKASTVNYTDEYHSTPWGSADKESDCCEWKGVKCSLTTGRVIKLALNSTIYWSGESGGGWYFNASLFLPFEDLQYLDLSWNYIPGWVSNEGFKRFSALSKLELLHLDGNSFNNSILSSLSGIASLKELYLGSNNLNGSIPIQEFKAFSNMEELYLNANEIKDFVTTNDSNILSKLQLLDLSETKISIRILESSAAFPSLRTLYLTYNNLKGSFTTKGMAVRLSSAEADGALCAALDAALGAALGALAGAASGASPDAGEAALDGAAGVGSKGVAVEDAAGKGALDDAAPGATSGASLNAGKVLEIES